MTPKEIEEVFKRIQTKNSPGSDSLRAEFDQNFKEILIPILLKLFQIIEQGTLPNSFYNSTITLILKLHRLN